MDESLQILLVEDNPGDAFLLKFYLEESALRSSKIIHSEYLKTALDLLSKNSFDVIILDLNLPDSTGIETLKSILEMKNDAVVIVLTGLQDEDLGIQTVKLGAQDFLVKGQFDGKVFTSSIRYAFERAQIRREIKRFTEEMHRLEYRFDIVQRITHAGYWRIIINDNTFACSEYFHEIFELKEEVNSLKKFIELFDESCHKEIHDTIEKALKDKSGFIIPVKFNDGKNATLKSTGASFNQNNEEILAGVVQV